jgi:hypothetical protein
VSELAPELLQADGVFFKLQTGFEADSDWSLPLRDARNLVAALARGIEEGAFRSQGGGRGTVLENLRRVETALLHGSRLGAKSWRTDANSSIDDLMHSLVDGKTARMDAVTLLRKKDTLKVNGDLLGDRLPCPTGAICVERDRAISATFYGRIDRSADIRVGARTSFHDATLALEMSEAGPHASLVLPVGKWLRLGSWLPLGAYVELGLDGISAGPRYLPVEPSPSVPSL